MKFVCKDFWMSMYKKQIDNLRTNHQGVYVLQDNRFKMLTQLSNSKQYLEAAPRVSTSVTVNSTGGSIQGEYLCNSKQYREAVPRVSTSLAVNITPSLYRVVIYTDVVFQYLAFPCGLIRGALANLGIVCVVTAEVNTMPACKYTFYSAATSLLR